MKGSDIIEKHRGVFSRVLATEEGREMMALLRASFVDVNLMGATDRETVMRVAKHDLVIYMSEMGGLKDV